MRIHIIGCSGTGKTYFAQKLSQKLQIPCYDLDELQWDNTANVYGVKTSPDIRDMRLLNILDTDSWILEGVYFKWVSASFALADQIYLLDIPPVVYKARILRRFLRRKLGLERGKKETLRSVWELLLWTDKYHKIFLPQIRTIMLQYQDKFHVITSKKQIREILK